jgi:acyl-CoA thioesterase FadM
MAIGRTVQVTFDYAAARPVPLPDLWRQAIVDFEVL